MITTNTIAQRDDEIAHDRPDLPPLSLLNEDQGPEIPDPEREQKMATTIIRQFRQHGIDVKLIQTIHAHRVSTYQLAVPEGEEYQVNQVDDALRQILEMALGVSGISIYAPMKDSSFLAVQVPQKENHDPIGLVDFVNEARRNDLHVPFPLGEDWQGHPCVIDLAECGHQLVAGQTGSGKSACLKSFITTVGLTKTPDDVQLLLIDGKGLDLSCFEAWPHLLDNVIIDPFDADDALRAVVAELERRQITLREAGVHDIHAYRQLQSESDDRPLPYLIVLIDEVQVLTQQSNGRAFDLLRPIAQRGRACGVLLVIATQRPTADIVQGAIKANVAGRICYRLPTQVDSRVVLDSSGAENLRSPADLLAIQTTHPELQRFQAPWVSPDEIQRVTEYLESKRPDQGTEQQECAPLKFRPLVQNTEPRKYRPKDSSETDESDRLMLHNARFAPTVLSYDEMKTALKASKHAGIPRPSLQYRLFAISEQPARWHTRRALFDIGVGHFIVSLKPLEVSPFWSEMDELTERQSSLLLYLITAGGRLANSDSVDEDDLWVLVERGFAIPSPKGVRIRPAYAELPACCGELTTTLTPESDVQMPMVPTDLKQRLRRLRRDCARFWQADLSSLTLAYLPFWIHRLNDDHCLHIPAFITGYHDLDTSQLYQYTLSLGNQHAHWGEVQGN